MSKLTVAILDEELPWPLNSGKRIRTFNLVRRLADHHRLIYVAHRNSDPDEANLAEGAFRDLGIEPILVDRPVPKKSGVRFYGRLLANLLSSVPYSVETHDSPWFRDTIRHLHASRQIDLWHCEWTPYAQAIRHLPRDRDFPRWVVMAHNVESLIWQRYTETESNPLKRWYIRQQWKKFEAFERWAYSTANGTMTVSEEDATLVRDRFGGKYVKVIDNGVDTEYFRPKQELTETPLDCLRREPRRMLFLGSLDWRPNLDAVQTLIREIFPKVRAIEPHAVLEIVGRNPPDWLRAEAATTSGIELHANVPDVRPHLARAGMLVVPLRIGGGSRLKIIEALSFGLPVVTSRIGVEGLRFDDETHLVIVDECSQMHEAVCAGIRDPQRMNQLALQGRQRVLAEYDWEPIADQMATFWDEIARTTITASV